MFKSKYYPLGSKENKKAKQILTLDPGCTTVPFEFWLDPYSPPSGDVDSGSCGVRIQYYVEVN